VCSKIFLTILRTNLVQTLSQIVLTLLMVSWADVTLKIAKTLRKKTSMFYEKNLVNLVLKIPTLHTNSHARIMFSTEDMVFIGVS
jgi:hypothetical protein